MDSQKLEQEFHVSRYIIAYKFLLGLVELVLGVGILIFGKHFVRLYQNFKRDELLENPHDFLVMITEKIIPYIMIHRGYVVLILVVIGLVKMAGAIGLLYRKRWGLDLLVGLTLLLLPFDAYYFLNHPSFTRFIFLLINTLISLYLVNFKPQEYVLRFKNKIKMHKPSSHLVKKTTLRIIFIILLVITGMGIYKFIFWQTKPVTETIKGEMKQLPPEVKEKLNKETARSTHSSTLRVPILMYHYVEYIQDKRDPIRQSLNINPNVFEKQLQTLISAGYQFLTARELGEILDNKTPSPEKPILLTFDDGHRDFYTNVLPLLEKYHLQATAYIIPGFLGGSDFLTKEQLQKVIESNLVDIGAHTVHHISLKSKLYPIVKIEIDKSEEMLEKDYHIHVVSFAYPNGAFDRQAIDLVKVAGFTTAVSTIPGIIQSRQNRFFLYRLRPGYRTGDALLRYLEQNRFRPY